MVYFASANDDLREWWRLVCEKAPAYGFGRCETLPILSNSKALAYIYYVPENLPKWLCCEVVMKFGRGTVEICGFEFYG